MMRYIKKIIFFSAALFAIALKSSAQKSDLLFPQSPGIVSYTYRTTFQKDVPVALDIVKSNGITDIEFSNLFNKTPEELRKLIDERGIKCSSYGVGYDDLVNKSTQVAAAAKTLG